MTSDRSDTWPFFCEKFQTHQWSYQKASHILFSISRIPSYVSLQVLLHRCVERLRNFLATQSHLYLQVICCKYLQCQSWKHDSYYRHSDDYDDSVFASILCFLRTNVVAEFSRSDMALSNVRSAVWDWTAASELRLGFRLHTRRKSKSKQCGWNNLFQNNGENTVQTNHKGKQSLSVRICNQERVLSKKTVSELSTARCFLASAGTRHTVRSSSKHFNFICKGHFVL